MKISPSHPQAPASEVRSSRDVPAKKSGRMEHIKHACGSGLKKIGNVLKSVARGLEYVLGGFAVGYVLERRVSKSANKKVDKVAQSHFSPTLTDQKKAARLKGHRWVESLVSWAVSSVKGKRASASSSVGSKTQVQPQQPTSKPKAKRKPRRVDD